MCLISFCAGIAKDKAMSVRYIHLANFLSSAASKDKLCMKKLIEGKITTLETFWKKKELIKVLDANPSLRIFLDSGAHSLLNAQVGLINKGDIVKTNKKDKMEFTSEEFMNRLSVDQRIDYASKGSGAVQFFADWSFNKNPDVRKYLDDYIAFIHKYKNQLMGYVNLDIIYNAEESWENQKYMEENGLRPIPVFHYGEDFKWWKFYVDNYDYIGIGGVAGGITLQQFVTSLGDKAFKYIVESNPDVKVHGFAVTSISLLKRYRFFSVDSTTWLKHSAYGNIMLPKYDSIKRKFDYGTTPFIISVSEISLHKSSKDPHYSIAFPSRVVERIEEYFSLIGVDKEKLKVDNTEREKANISYFENLLKDECVSDKNNSKVEKTFF